jgi:phosphate-selective porin OprO/OprP
MRYAPEFNDNWIAALSAALLVVTSPPLLAADAKVKDNGFGLVSADGQNSINIYGQFHFDSRNISNGLAESNDKDTASGGDQFEIRRARLGVNGTVMKDIDYEFITNTLGSNPNLVHRAYVNYSFNKQAQLRVGRFKQPFSMEEMSSANGIDFMERSYGDQLVPSHRLGAMMHGEPFKGFTYGISLYQNGFNENTNTNNVGNSHAARITLNLAEIQNIKDTILHVGLSMDQGRYSIVPTTSANTGAAAEEKSRATILSIRSENRGMANVYRAQLSGDLVTAGYGVSGNNVANVSSDLKGLEAVLASNAWKFQAEYIKAGYSAWAVNNTTVGGTPLNANMDVAVDTHYYQVVYNLTGENWTSAYKSGVFGTIKPKSNFSMGSGGGTGAWQLALRVSDYKANKAAQTVQTVGTNTSRTENSFGARTTTYGVNWILNPHSRWMLNLARTNFDAPVTYLTTTPSPGTTTKEDVLSLRWQLSL